MVGHASARLYRLYCTRAYDVAETTPSWFRSPAGASAAARPHAQRRSEQSAPLYPAWHWHASLTSHSPLPLQPAAVSADAGGAGGATRVAERARRAGRKGTVAGAPAAGFTHKRGAISHTRARAHATGARGARQRRRRQARAAAARIRGAATSEERERARSRPTRGARAPPAPSHAPHSALASGNSAAETSSASA